jgi:hypothetical protein
MIMVNLLSKKSRAEHMQHDANALIPLIPIRR